MDAVGLLHLVTEPTRSVLLQRLRAGPATVAELTVAADGEQSNISHHLRRLRDEGVVVVTATGRRRRYRLADREVERILDQLQAAATRLHKIGTFTRMGLPADSNFHGYG